MNTLTIFAAAAALLLVGGMLTLLDMLWNATIGAAGRYVRRRLAWRAALNARRRK